jgi:hypothetical protein
MLGFLENEDLCRTPGSGNGTRLCRIAGGGVGARLQRLRPRREALELTEIRLIWLLLEQAELSEPFHPKPLIGDGCLEFVSHGTVMADSSQGMTCSS